jgi:hypothetical protein
MTILVTIAAFAILMAMMAVGVILGGRRLHGSCGGVGGEDCICDETGKPILKPDCDDDFHACEKDPSTCEFATRACELKHAREGGGMFGAALRAVAAETAGGSAAKR